MKSTPIAHHNSSQCRNNPTVTISLLPKLTAVIPTPITTEFSTLCELLSSPEILLEKLHGKLINGCGYLSPEDIDTTDPSCWDMDEEANLQVRRNKKNLANMSILLLDYDSGVPISDIKKQLSQYLHFGYTTFSHTPHNHRFRVLVPLAEPIPLNHQKTSSHLEVNGLLNQLQESLKLEFPKCDPSSFDPNRFFFISSCSKGNVENFKSWLNDGDLYDWRHLELTPIESIKSITPKQPAATTTNTIVGKRYIHPDDTIQTKSGIIRAGDIKGHIQGVTCPFHNDRNGTEFIKVSQSGRKFLHCRRCGETYYVEDPDNPSHHPQDALLYDDDGYDFSREFQDGSDRTTVKTELADIFKKVTGSSSRFLSKCGPIYHAHVIYMPEGSGKSWLVTEIAKSSKVIFVVKSYKQAEEHYENLKQHGLQHDYDVDIHQSLDGLIQQRFGVKPVRAPVANPYTLGKILFDETVQKVLEANPNFSEAMIRLTINFCRSGERYNFHHPNHSGQNPVRIVIMTQTMLRTLNISHNMPSKDWSIIIDDPSPEDIVDIAPVDRTVTFDEAKNDAVIQRSSGQFYYQRDNLMSLGKPFSFHRIVYTTTEKVTLRLIEDHYKRFSKQRLTAHKKMHDVFGGRISILGTKMVRKSHDGLLPVIIRHISKRHSNDLVFIADGLASKHNHTNTKGKNNLTDVDTILEVSIPHPDAINTICDWLNESFTQIGRDITVDIMLDKIHQGFGRNSGYRGNEHESVALVDPDYHKILTNACRYKLSKKDCTIVDKTQSMSRLDKRISDTASPLVRLLVEYLNYPEKIFCDFRYAKPAIKAVLADIDDDEKKLTYLVRLAIGMSNVSGLNWLRPKAVELKGLQCKYSELFNWILDEFTDSKTRDMLFDLLRKDEEERVRRAQKLVESRRSNNFP